MAEPHRPVWPLLAVRPDHSKCLSMLIIIGRNHPALPCGQVLRSVEAENSHVSNAPNPFTIILSAVSLSSILNHHHTLTPGQLRNPRTPPTLVGKYLASKNFYGRVDFFLSEKRLIDSDELSQLIEFPILSRLVGLL